VLLDAVATGHPLHLYIPPSINKLPITLPYIYLRLAFGEPPPPIRRRHSPLEPGMVWIRGAEFEPVLSSLAEVDEQVARLEELRRHR